MHTQTRRCTDCDCVLALARCSSKYSPHVSTGPAFGLTACVCLLSVHTVTQKKKKKEKIYMKLIATIGRHCRCTRKPILASHIQCVIWILFYCFNRFTHTLVQRCKCTQLCSEAGLLRFFACTHNVSPATTAQSHHTGSDVR